MRQVEVTMVRVYLTEAGGRLQHLLAYLHDESRVHGVTVFRGVSGFGRSGRIHSSTLLDMSLDLPVVIEFFDEPDRAEAIVERLHHEVGPGHVVQWRAHMNADVGEEGG